MLIFKFRWAPCPLRSPRGNSGFAVEHLTLSRSLPLVHHYKETAAPHSSFSQVTIAMRPRKARAVGFRFEFSCCRNTVGPNMGRGGFDHAWGGWVSTVRDFKNYKWGKNMFRFLVSHPAAQEGERNKWDAVKERTVFLSACGQTKGWRRVTNVALFKSECCIFGLELKSQMALSRCSAQRMLTIKLFFFLSDGLMHRYNANMQQ